MSARSFWENVLLDDGCWEWTGSHDREGYGRFQHNAAHRAAYERLIGPIPPGLVIDHLCRNRGCQNPAHMEAVTIGENARRGIQHNLLKTHCPAGHAFDASNTYIRPKGQRACRTCHRGAQIRYSNRRNQEGLAL